MKKGFTLAEMLAVILILAIILLIGMPIYQNVQKSTNEGIYESKISNVKSKAEIYSEEHGIFVFDIRQMIAWGLITPDNESGEYRDPVTGRDMRCDVVQVSLDNNHYYASVSPGYDSEGKTICYGEDELKSMNSVVRIVFYTSENENERYDDTWIHTNKVYAGYELIGIPDAENISVTWNEIGRVLNNDRMEITVASILNTYVMLHIEFDYAGKHIIQDVSKLLRVDNENPIAEITSGPGVQLTPNLAVVEWKFSDMDGSGIAGHVLIDQASYSNHPCSSYTADEIPGDNSFTNTSYLDNGNYYMCVKDNVGNIGEKKVEVTNVNQVSGDISNFKVTTRTPPYQLMEVKFTIDLNLEGNVSDGYQMCISANGDYGKCDWEPYQQYKDYDIKNANYGSTVRFFLSVKSPSGYISNKETTYVIDNLQSLNLNGRINGNNYDDLRSAGKCDVYVNGEKKAGAVTNFDESYPPGSSFAIKNCISNSGYRYKGTNEITGIVQRSGVTYVYVPYVSLYTISYNMNGGSGSVAAQTKEHGTNINLQTTNSTKAGYTFGGWNTKSDGTGTNYNAGGAYSGNGNATLYAKWNPKIITIPLNNQSASSAGTTNVYYKYNINAYYSNSGATTGMSSITKPTKTGHTFKGYYSSTNGGGTQYINASGGFVNNLYKAFTGNTTLYAYWTVNSYTVTWNANGGSCNKTSSAHNYNTAIGTLPTCSRTNYTFLGWFTAASGGSQISTSTKVTGNVTYFAHWKENHKTPADLKVGDVIYYILPASKGGGKIKAIVMDVSGGTAKVIPETVVETYNATSSNMWTVTSNALSRAKQYLNTAMASDVQIVGSGQGDDPHTETSKEAHTYVGKRSLIDTQVSQLNTLKNKGFTNFYSKTYYTSCKETERRSCSGNYTLVQDSKKITDAGFMIYYGDNWARWGSGDYSTNGAEVGIGALSGWTTVSVDYDSSNSSMGYYEVQTALVPIITLKNTLKFTTGNGTLANPYAIS